LAPQGPSSPRRVFGRTGVKCLCHRGGTNAVLRIKLHSSKRQYVRALSMNPGDFFSELRRRNVYKVAVAYAVIGWLLIQIATQTFPFLEIPNWAIRLVIMLLVIGFPISLLLAWAFELTPQGIKRAESADAARQHSSGGAWIFIVAVGAILSVGLFFLGRYTASKHASSAANQIVGPPSKSVAVLPFANLSRDPDNAYFAAGIQDEIITRLAKIGDLKVVSCLSTQRFKSAPDDLPAIANQLGVATILQGSVQRTADTVRVNVQLVKAETDNHLWADTFDRKLTDVFQIESDIAKTIAEKLQAKLTGSEERALSIKPTADSEAYQLYLQGRYLWNRRTGQNLKKALSYFQQAVEKDPNFALAYTGIADSCALIPVYGAGTPKDYYPRAKAAAEKALQLDDTLAEAHTSLANVFFRYLELDKSAREFERSIQLNPNYPTSRQWYGRLTLLALGQFDHAIAEAKRAVELDPVSPIGRTDVATVYLMERRYDEAIAELHNTLEMDPDFYWAHRQLGVALELKGAPSEAVVEYQRASELNDDPRVLAFVAHAMASMGKQNEAREILTKLTEIAKTRYVTGYSFAVIHLGLEEKNQAVDWLEKDAREQTGFEINFIRVDPYLDPLRGDPRFEALVAKVLSGSVK
jgi:TolB-like protein